MSISNWADYPPELFALTPGEVSCASRTWVTIVDADTEDEIYAFCGWSQPADLADIWFGTPAGFAPPRLVYVELDDHQGARSVSSNPVTVCPLGYGPSCGG